MLFRKKNKKELLAKLVHHCAAAKLAQLLLHIQVVFARFMNKQAAKMGVPRIKMLLAVFCLAGAGLSIYILVTALLPGYPAVIHQQHIRFLQTDTSQSTNKK